MARLLKGTLYKRGKAGTYHLKFSVNGKIFRQVLKDGNGKAITDEKKALIAKDIILAPYRAKSGLQLREQAVAALNTAEDKAIKADAIIEDRENPPLKIADAWASYVEALNRPQSGEYTMINYLGHFNVFREWLNKQKQKPVFLKEITPEFASKFAVSLNKAEKSANTFNKYTSFLKLFFKVLAKPAQLINNPFADITRKNLTPLSRRELSIDELKKILTEATGDMALLFGIGTFTGLRLGDCCTLQWNEIDFKNRIIKRIPNKTAKKQKPVKIGIPAPLFYHLAEIPEKLRKGFVLPEIAEQYLGNYSRSRLCQKIQTVFKNAGIETQKPGTGPGTGKRAVVEVGFHSLRHTYVSIHAMGGTPQAIIQDNVGHSNPAMTSHYTHTSDEAARRVAGALEAPFMDVIPVEPERDKLKQLADSLPIEKVREFLNSMEKQ